MDLQVVRPGLGFYINRLNNNQPFSFVRFGNGEWDCIFNRAKRTGSGSQSLTNPLLKVGMRAAMAYKDDSYFRALQSPSYLARKGLIRLIGNAYPNVRWYFGEVFHYASKRGQLGPMISSLRNLRIGIVGPSHLQKLNKYFELEWFVEVAKKDCFKDYHAIRSEILTQEVVDVYSFSAGPAAKLLIHELHLCLSNRASLIDFGSLWDPYCGVRSRYYHRRVTKSVIKENMDV